MSKDIARSERFKPKFLDIITNDWAGDTNPHKVGVYLRSGYRHLNPSKYFVLTDMQGKDTWEMGMDSVKAGKLHIIGNLLTAHDTEKKQRLLDLLEYEPQCDCETDGLGYHGKWCEENGLYYGWLRNELRKELRQAVRNIFTRR